MKTQANFEIIRSGADPSEAKFGRQVLAEVGQTGRTELFPEWGQLPF